MTRPAPALLALLLLAAPAAAVIKVLTPLKQVLDAEPMIFTAEVAAVDPAKPAATFKFGENLKGKCDVETFAVNLTGDSYAKKDNHTRVLLDRLAEGRKLVVFMSKTAKGYSAFAFVEGTWFQVQGTRDADGKTVRWAFLHCEPYFRRTFKGTTAELKEVVEKYVAGKGDPPAPDEKEPPGYGPKAEKKDGERPADKQVFLPSPLGGEGPGVRGQRPQSDREAHPSPLTPLPQGERGTGGLFAVIPSFVLVGPLAVVAALFPGVFARLAVALKRWRAFLVVASINSTLALAYFAARGYLPDHPALGGTAFAVYLLVVAAVGLVVAGRRYRRMAAADPAVTAPPARNELLTLAGLTLLTGLILAATAAVVGRAELVRLPWREFTAIGAGLAAAAAYAAYRAATKATDVLAYGVEPVTRLSLSGESVGLAAMIVFGAAVLAATGPREPPAGFAGGGAVGDAGSAAAAGPRLADAAILFETADASQVMSSPVVAGDRVYVGGLRQSGFRQRGCVYAIDRATGKPVWSFDDGGELMPVYSTPAVAGGRVYVGEGLHTDADRRLFALDAATGKPAWSVPTKSHTEGSPLVAGDRVIFSAGDDGLYCVSAADGKELWHVRGAEQKLHVDTPPAAAGRRVFFGSGYNTRALLCADVNTGQELWRTPVNLRSFGPPLARGNRVYFGLGTGNLADDLSTEPEEGVPPETAPAGAVVCADAATGQIVWRAELPKSVHTPLAADLRTVYACCKDGWVYALARSGGALRWKRQVGVAFAAGPAVAAYANGAAPLAVYAVSKEGRAVCLSPADGAVLWGRDLGEYTKKDVEVISTPVVVAADPAGARRHVYFGAMLTNRNNAAKSAAVFRIEDVVEE